MTYTQDPECEGEPIRLFFYEVGYGCMYIVISVTVPADRLAEPAVAKTLGDIEAMIPAIGRIPAGDATIFEPKYTDLADIDRRISQVQGIAEEDIGQAHESGRSLELIQQALDSGRLGVGKTFELQSLGLALGDYIRCTDNAFHWAVVRDWYGRDACLQYKNMAMTAFPLTMISKRVGSGEVFDAGALARGMMKRVAEVAARGGFRELGHNF